jgi:hypothetical protein
MATENITATVMEQFAQKIDNDTEYTVSELKRVLGEVYKSVQLSIAEKKKAEKANNGEKPRKVRTKRERDEDGNIIKKRAPSAYNTFIKEQSAIIKQANAKLDPKTIFKMAIAEWKKNKGTEDNGNAVEPEPVETKSADAKPEPTPEPADNTNPVDQMDEDIKEASQPPILKPKKTAARKPKKAAANADDSNEM